MAKTQWFGYGEDALTYWALQTRLACILDQLNDKSSEGETIVFYRPSFGRRGCAIFGEFDAIIATPQAIYPIEAKWSKSSEVKNGGIEITDKQIKRHEIFAWYLERYAACRPQSWEDFVKLNDPAFRRKFSHKKFSYDRDGAR